MTIHAPTPDPLDDDDADGTDGAADDRMHRLVQRPDGYHWLDAEGRQEFGPFETMEEALADMDGAGSDAPEPGESLAEAEQELGMADWIDPDTGAPAEGTSTRIEEDH